MENPYSRALDAHIRRTGMTQAGFGKSAGFSQGAIWQWSRGYVLPSKRAAKVLDQVTEGAVSFSLWKAVRIERLDA
jgi:DNA-binding transcriptional regulator YiaG